MNVEKMFFVHLTNMEKYCGYEKDVYGGGRFPEKEGYGWELFNFQNDGGKCYGYTAPHGKVKVDKIEKENISEDINGKYVDDVLVVFTCEGKSCKRVIAGVYQYARVYANAVNDNRPSRKFKDSFVTYNIICDVTNAILISRDERTFEIPHSSKKGGGGYGQSNIWYANNLNDKPIRKRVLEYIDSIIKRKISDEPKYHLYDENKITITTTTQITRNQKAREECIKIKGCRCNICGFDFKEKYGGLGENYIEVHHITPIGSLSTSVEYEGTNPEKDLIPLCSNCHSMIHRKNPPYSPTEIKKRVVNAPN